MSIFYARKTARNSLLVHRHKPLESLSSDEYLERTGVKLFAEDAIKQLVLDRSDNAVRSFERYFSSQATAHIDITRGPKIHFRRLFTCFKACFVYNEFLRYTHDIYGQVLQGDTKKALDSVLTEIQTSDRRRSSVIAAKFGEKIVLQLQAAHTSTSELFVLPPIEIAL
ncbi:hypothetical protein DYB25_009394 [Aphanomyces astaci]|uniref:Uncharacterized protein n=1 Tax=Aphanomyces astaci TaxID=112090 RepID=A0A397AD28_APHAT|nr:hypothetical protein DYB36_000269 [Aphanomyces astaci]RHY12187.1 hypothetical protein DYB25_009394 [Aphanomyces astaci]